MYCKNCGNLIDDNALYCTCCGTKVNNTPNTNESDDGLNILFGILGFFFPIVGLILYLVYESKKPKRAKSAGKGALIGFITKIVISIILAILYFVFAFSMFNNFVNKNEISLPNISNVFQNESTDEILKNDVDVSFGKFKANDYDTSLEVTVKNKSSRKYSFDITVEAVDKDNKRIETDIIIVDDLRPGQSASETAFELVDENKIEQFKNATFKVLEVNKYSY